MVALLSVLSSVQFHSLIGRVLIKKSGISGLNMKFVPLFSQVSSQQFLGFFFFYSLRRDLQFNSGI